MKALLILLPLILVSGVFGWMLCALRKVARERKIAQNHSDAIRFIEGLVAQDGIVPVLTEIQLETAGQITDDYRKTTHVL